MGWASPTTRTTPTGTTTATTVNWCITTSTTTTIPVEKTTTTVSFDATPRSLPHAEQASPATWYSTRRMESSTSPTLGLAEFSGSTPTTPPPRRRTSWVRARRRTRSWQSTARSPTWNGVSSPPAFPLLPASPCTVTRSSYRKTATGRSAPTSLRMTARAPLTCRRSTPTPTQSWALR